MAKKKYKVKKGDNFINISKKLYGDNSYSLDLIKANPGFNYLGPGMVIELPDEDPRESRRRREEARLKDWESIKRRYNIGPDLKAGQPLPTYQPPPPPPESTEWWNDPAYEDELIDLMVETVQSMGLDESAMLYEFGLSEQDPAAADRTEPKPPPKEKKKVGPGHIMPKITIPQWPPPPPQPADEESDLPEPDQSGMRYPKPEETPLPLTDEQIAELKATFAKMGLDESAMMYEFGLSESDPASADAPGAVLGRTKETLGDLSEEDKPHQTDITEWLVNELNIQTPILLDEIGKYKELSQHQEGAGLGYPWWLYGSHLRMFTAKGLYDIKPSMKKIKSGAIVLFGDQGGRWVDSSVPGNIMFGYLSAARGINQRIAWLAGGLLQILDTGEMNPDFKDSYYDKPEDKTAVDFGYYLYEKYKGEMTVDDFKRELNLDWLDSFQKPEIMPDYPAKPQTNTYPQGYFLRP